MRYLLGSWVQLCDPSSVGKGRDQGQPEWIVRRCLNRTAVPQLVVAALLGSSLHGNRLLKQSGVELMSFIGHYHNMLYFQRTTENTQCVECMLWTLLLQYGLSAEFLFGMFWKWLLELSSHNVDSRSGRMGDGVVLAGERCSSSPQPGRAPWKEALRERVDDWVHQGPP